MIKVNKDLNYATPGASGFDIEAAEKVIINAGRTVRVKTGLRVSLPYVVELQVRPRSGLSSQGIFVVLGTVDSDYRGEISVIIHNSTDEFFLVEPGMRIAQGVFSYVEREFTVVPEQEILAEKTERGENGFGSTGI